MTAEQLFTVKTSSDRTVRLKPTNPIALVTRMKMLSASDICKGQPEPKWFNVQENLSCYDWALLFDANREETENLGAMKQLLIDEKVRLMQILTGMLCFFKDRKKLLGRKLGHLGSHHTWVERITLLRSFVRPGRWLSSTKSGMISSKKASGGSIIVGWLQCGWLFWNAHKLFLKSPCCTCEKGEKSNYKKKKILTGDRKKVLWLGELDVLESEPMLFWSTFILWYFIYFHFLQWKSKKINSPTLKYYHLISFGTLYTFPEDISAGVQWSRKLSLRPGSTDGDSGITSALRPLMESMLEVWDDDDGSQWKNGKVILLKLILHLSSALRFRSRSAFSWPD